MRAGELTEVITIQRQTVSRDANGAMQQSWTDLMTLRASYSAAGGSRRNEYMDTFQSSSCTFYTHYRPAIKGADRVRYNGKTYIIQGEPVHRRLEDLTIINAELDRS